MYLLTRSRNLLLADMKRPLRSISRSRPVAMATTPHMAAAVGGAAAAISADARVEFNAVES